MRRGTLMLLVVAARLLADGGAVQLHEESGPFAVTVFASPSPPRTGPVDISVLVQDRESLGALLDADVTVHLWHGTTELTAQATRAQAQNKFLYAATLNVLDSGEWKYSVTVQRGSVRTEVSSSTIIAAAQAGLSSHWAAIAVAPLCILLFSFHQFLTRRPRRAS
jgi:hypothetical protein